MLHVMYNVLGLNYRRFLETPDEVIDEVIAYFMSEHYHLNLRGMKTVPVGDGETTRIPMHRLTRKCGVLDMM